MKQYKVQITDKLFIEISPSIVQPLLYSGFLRLQYEPPDRSLPDAIFFRHARPGYPVWSSGSARILGNT